MKKLIVLASRSPWRKRLLLKYGIACIARASKFNEKKRHVNPYRLVLHNACGKAAAVAARYKNALVIGVDTLGVLGNKIIGKPKTVSEAKKILNMLSGKTHRVLSGVCVIDTARTCPSKKYTTVAVTKVTFVEISRVELEKYLNSGQWKGKAGAYAIQGRAKRFIKKIEGDVTNVVGVPIRKLNKILKICYS